MYPQMMCRVERFGHPHHNPRHQRADEQGQYSEDPAPVREQQNDGAQGGRGHRHHHEDEHDERHDPRHHIALIAIAHNADDDDPARRGEKPRHEPPCQHQREGGGESTDQVRYQKQRHRPEQHRLAAVMIRQRAVDQRAARQAEKEHADDKLAVIGVGNGQRMPDVGQGWQHRID
jgi:hypothetical protein